MIQTCRHHEKAEGFCGDPATVASEMPVFLDDHATSLLTMATDFCLSIKT